VVCPLVSRARGKNCFSKSAHLENPYFLGM